MTQDEMAQYAKELFDKGFHCSQAVFAAAMERMGEEARTDVIAALSPFGGGIASTGNTCGTILGAIAVIGLLEGKRTPEQRDGRMLWKKSHGLFMKFQEITREYGGTDCRDIARVDWRDPKDVKRFRKDPESRRKECFRVIELTAKALCEIIDEIKSSG